jgi:hypothetical protein
VLKVFLAWMVHLFIFIVLIRSDGASITMLLGVKGIFSMDGSSVYIYYFNLVMLRQASLANFAAKYICISLMLSTGSEHHE